MVIWFKFTILSCKNYLEKNTIMKKYTVQLVLSSLVLFSVTLSGAPGNPLKEVRSPNGTLVVNITLGDEIVLMASLKDRKALTVKNPGMVINGTKTATGNFTIKTRTVNREHTR
jgi:hypothetical protein